MDNVSVQYRPDINPNGTECIAPAPANQNLVRNGDFGATTEQWTFGFPGEIDYQVTNGVLHFMRRAISPNYASVRQDLNYSLSINSPFEINLDLANDSNVMKQVSVVLLPMSWNGASACDFTLSPHSSLRRYTVRGRKNVAFPNIRLEVYASPADGIPDISMDNVSVQYRPDINPNGTECFSHSILSTVRSTVTTFLKRAKTRQLAKIACRPTCHCMRPPSAPHSKYPAACVASFIDEHLR